MYMKPTIAKLFDIQYKEVADVAQQIEKLARKLSQAASQEDSPPQVPPLLRELAGLREALSLRYGRL